MTQLKSVLAANLKAYRKAKGLTQERLAEKVNTASTYIAMIESSRRTPSFGMIEKIAGVLEIEPTDLFSLEFYPRESTKHIHDELLQRFETFLSAAAKEISPRSVSALGSGN